MQCLNFMNAPGVTNLVQLQVAPSVRAWAVNLRTIHTESCSTYLSRAEMARADRLIDTQIRTNYLASHLALRFLLAHATGVPASALQFIEGKFGKPELQIQEPIFFSLSHRGDWALVGLSQGKGANSVGVDIEELAPTDHLGELAEHVLTDKELIEFKSLSERDRNSAFLGCWTRKEACLKAIGLGLHLEPNCIDTGLSHHALPRKASINMRESALLVHTCTKNNQFVASLAFTLE